MSIRSILNLDEVKVIINELYGIYKVVNENVDKEIFEVAFLLSKYLGKDFNNIYSNLERIKEMEYKLDIGTKYEVISDLEIEVDFKENIEKRIKANKENEKYIFLTKSIIKQEINTKCKIIDFKVITEKLMDLKGVADKIYINYQDYKRNGMSSCENGRLLFVNAKKLVDLNEEEMKKEDMFSHNIRGDEGINKNVIKSIIETIKEKNYKLMLGNNGLTIVCEKININHDKEKFELINAIVVNGGQTLRTLNRCKDKLTDDIVIACKFIECGEEGVTYLDNIAKISNNHIAIKNKELNSNIKKYYSLNKTLNSDIIDEAFRKELVHKIGQIPKGAYITKQEVYMLENVFKNCTYEFELMKKEIDIINETNTKEIIVLYELKKFLVDQIKNSQLDRYEELKQKYTEKRLNYQIYYLANLILHNKKIIDNPEKREKFIEEAYKKLVFRKDMNEIIGEKIVTLIISTINLYMNYRLNQKESNDKFRRGLNSDEEKTFFQYMNEVERISNKIK